jgi:hypothetical protein
MDLDGLIYMKLKIKGTLRKYGRQDNDREHLERGPDEQGQRIFRTW